MNREQIPARKLTPGTVFYRHGAAWTVDTVAVRDETVTLTVIAHSTGEPTFYSFERDSVVTVDGDTRFETPAPGFTPGDRVRYDGDRAGTVVQTSTDMIGFVNAVQVETDAYSNRMWFEAGSLKPADAATDDRTLVTRHRIPARDVQPGHMMRFMARPVQVIGASNVWTRGNHSYVTLTFLDSGEIEHEEFFADSLRHVLNP